VILVRVLLFLSLATIGVSLLLYAVKRDRRYLRFVGQVVKFTLVVLVIVLLMFAAQRLMMPAVTPPH
jgi:cytochrome bd-type quinol oxidase subunit 2